MRNYLKALLATVMAISLSLFVVACDQTSSSVSDDKSDSSIGTSQSQSTTSSESSVPDAPVEYSVTFSVKDGQAPATQTVKEGGKVADPGAATQAPTEAETFTFIGWFAENSENAWKFDTDTVKNNLVLTAKFTNETRKYDVTVKIDGTAFGTYNIAYGKSLTKDYLTELPSREGYNYTLMQNGVVYNFDDVVTGECTVELTSKWTFDGKVLNYDESADGISTNWRFNAESETHDGKVCSISYTTDEKYGDEAGSVKVEAVWCSDDSHKGSAAEITLGSFDLREVDSTYFYIKTTAPTSLWFGNYYDTSRFDIVDVNGWLKVTIVKLANKTVDVTIGGVKYNYSLTADYGDSKEWDNLNDWNLCILDKEEKFVATQGTRYNVYFSAVRATFDYMLKADSILAQLPASANEVTHENAPSVLEAVEKYSKLADAYFSDAEKTAMPQKLLTELSKEATLKINDHAYFAGKMADDLPEYTQVTSENRDLTIENLIKYLSYVDSTFTNEEITAYTEPEKISFLRKYFVGSKYSKILDKTNVSTGASYVSSVTPVFWYQDLSGNIFSHAEKFETHAAGKQYFTLPAFDYKLFDNVQFGIHSDFSNAKHDYSVNGQTISSTQTNLLFCVSDGKLSVYNWNAEKLSEITLDEDTLSGKVGLKVEVETEGYGWYVLTNLSATLKTGDVQVFEITFNDVDGNLISKGYYLSGAQIVVPATDKLSYSTETTDYAFVDWNATIPETATADAVYTANQIKTEHKDGWAKKYAGALISADEITEDNSDAAYTALIAYLDYIGNNNITESFGVFVMPSAETVDAIKAKFAGDREIYIFSESNMASIANVAVYWNADEFTSRQSWLKVNNGANTSTAGVTVGKVVGDFTFTLPKINYSLYSKVNFAVAFGGNQKALLIGGEEITSVESNEISISVSEGKLVVTIYTISTLTVIKTVTITDPDIINGTKAFSFVVENKDWNWVVMANIHGQIK